MALTPTTTPWSALLDAGRTDGRLVREAFEGARSADVVAGSTVTFDGKTVTIPVYGF